MEIFAVLERDGRKVLVYLDQMAITFQALFLPGFL